MNYLRLYSYYGEPLAEIWPDDGDTVTVNWPLGKLDVFDIYRMRHQFARCEVVEQKMLER